MRCSLAIALVAVVTNAAFTDHRLMWPDESIPVPHLVHSFIVAECSHNASVTGEDTTTCISEESSGYRATVMMLSDPATGEKAAERYRACRAGLGTEAGRFHRHRAQCMGGSFQYVWRFQSTRRASIDAPDGAERLAAAGYNRASWE